MAEKIGMPPEQVFKTLVARGDRTGVLMACIPANTELDLKALAAASGNKKVELVAVKEVLGLTGLHPRRRVADRDQETLPVLPGRDGDSLGRDLGQRRSARLPDDSGAGRPDARSGCAIVRDRQKLRSATSFFQSLRSKFLLWTCNQTDVY